MRWSIAIVACVACGGGTSGGGISLADFRKQQFAAYCEHYVTCGLFPDQGSCTSFLQLHADDPSQQAAINAGKLGYDGTKAQQCLDAIVAGPCDQTQMAARVSAPACNEIFIGKVKQGQACEFDEECASGSCLIPGCNNACCPGQCGPSVQPAQIGASCAAVACVDTAYCDQTLTCRALVTQGGTCVDSSWCDFGLGCTGVSTGSGTCNPLPATGSPCPDQECASIGDVCNAQKICAAMGLPGAPCTGNGDCSYYYQCDTTMHCAAYPTVGQACTTLCSDGSWCMTSTCAAPQANGAACGTANQCASDYCDGMTSQCADLPACI